MIFVILPKFSARIMRRIITLIVAASCAIFSSFSLWGQEHQDSKSIEIGERIDAYLDPLASIAVKVTVKSVESNGDTVKLFLSDNVSDYSFRKNTVEDIYNIVKPYYPQKKIRIYANGSPLEELQSRFYNLPSGGTKARKDKGEQRNTLMVQDLSKPYNVTKGLNNRHIALWQSHGFYYEQSLQRWEWQRARILLTVEDLYTQSYVLPFLVPMLENAGANTFLPRERDFQVHEVIVDNDSMLSGYTEKSGENIWKRGDSVGFANKQAAYLFAENPFKTGSYREALSLSLNDVKKRGSAGESVAAWLPDIPEEGEYAVYVSYKTLPNSTDAAYYTVKYKGGEREFKVNQRMGGGTWIYLGKFKFSGGRNDEGVYLTNLNRGARSLKESTVVSADAVKFGGGMGNIARQPSQEGTSQNVKSSSNEAPLVTKIKFDVPAQVSGYPRFTEGSRYWLQWAGFEDTVYSYSHNMNDYNDDYVSRGRWVNAISGGSAVNPYNNGLNIPVDLSFAFHTDAGTFVTDSIVGTLAIYTKFSNGSDKYPTGESRMWGRELADIIQSEIVNDVRVNYEPQWSRRGLWDRSYAEARTPDVPAMLLELLSHQNFADMKYGLDPSFRFTVSRAIYKGMLKFLSVKNNVPYVVQPLPVKDFAAELDSRGGKNYVNLSWTPVNDPLEPTAVPQKYIIYTRVGDNGFDNGVVVSDTAVSLPVDANLIYSFKVAALNEGGESFPSEVLSAGVSEGLFAKGKSVMVVNGFTRVSAPASFQSKDSTLAGFYTGKDYGVPYLYDISFIGEQYEFRREIPWMDDDAAGFGASYSNFEDKVIAGNNFDYTAVHGKAFMKHGYSFVSSSVGAVRSGKVALDKYAIVDFAMGKQAQTKIGRGVKEVKYEVFPADLRDVITRYAGNGGNILVSGAYVASDLWDSYNVSDEGQKFAKEVLRFKWMTHYATKGNKVKSVANPLGFSGKYSFCNKLNDKIYVVEAPDALVPVDGTSFTIMRYSDNNISAGVAFKGNYRAVTLGFPIETLESEEQIDTIIGEMVSFFE